MKLYPSITLKFIVWLIALLIISFFGFSNFPQSQNGKPAFLDNLANWDGGHYVGIAKYGYSEKFQYAFFPLYPILINLASKITGNFITAAILISMGASFLALHILFELISLDYTKKLAEKSLDFLLFFPAAFYLTVAYSEGLFLFLTAAAFLFARKHKLLLATLFAALASGTRLVGLAVSLSLILQIYLTEGINKKNWAVLLSPLGFVAYCIYLLQTTGDPFYFIYAENHWQRVITVPGLSFWETIQTLSSGKNIAENFNAVLDLLFAVLGLGLILRSFRFLPIQYSVYSLLSIAFPLFTPTLSSIPRFLLPVFPIFIVLGLMNKGIFSFAYKIFSLMLLSAFVILFINGYWVS